MLVYQRIASLVESVEQCERHKAFDFAERHKQRIDELCKAYIKSKGFDSGIAFDLVESTPNKLVFLEPFRHVENVPKPRYTTHRVIVMPDLVNGFRVSVSGSNLNDVKDYIEDVFTDAMRTEVDERLKFAGAA